MKHRLDQIIPPEITIDSDFGQKLKDLASKPEVETILEIGSSSGEGSTKALFYGCRWDCKLFCIESSQGRFERLQDLYITDNTRCYNICSIPLDKYMTEDDIIGFYTNHETNTNNYHIGQVLGWRCEELEYIKEKGVQDNGIEFIKKENGIDFFDFVLIDGSAFTAEEELNQIYGARYIALDDTFDIKNYANYHKLLNDSAYKIIAEDQQLRNGYAIFKRMK